MENNKRNQEYALIRKAQIIQLKEDQPELTLAEIGSQVGLTRERVRQILHKVGLPTISNKMPPDWGTHKKPRGNCVICGDQIGSDRPLLVKYCGIECRNEGLAKHRETILNKTSYTTFNCANCGKEHSIRTALYNTQKKRGYKNQYCGNKCKVEVAISKALKVRREKYLARKEYEDSKINR